MMKRISRRGALKLGSSAAVSAAVGPFLDSIANTSAAQPLIRFSHGDSSMTSSPEGSLCFMTAREMAELIRQKKLSSREVMQAHLAQIKRVNPEVNAIVTLVDEDKLMAQALAADEALAKGNYLGPLHGLPVGVKDLHETAGIRTTYGSPLHRDFVPDFDCRVVQREKSAGAIVIGKTNVPEFGFGSQTFNPVFGATHNPYDVTKTCGGSTGGGCVALACGMVPLADGSDMGGSLRNPPNFCNVVGIRPSPGRVSNVPTRLGWATLSVPGPVARNVSDCAFLLSVLAGYDHHSPISIEQPGTPFAQPLGRDFKGARIAMFKDLGHVQEGRKLTGPYLSRMDAKRTALFQRMAAFLSKYEFFILPVNQVLPFDVNEHYPTEIAGVKMESYVAWMKSAYYISATGNPAMSVPCSFSSGGLPIGLQIVGRHHDEWGVLQMGYAFEQATQVGKRRPSIP
jgi:Asp-tRNA(Asn)/Glu-tRNA(Gln) amidotransferase A subunit family amidase